MLFIHIYHMNNAKLTYTQVFNLALKWFTFFRVLEIIILLRLLCFWWPLLFLIASFIIKMCSCSFCCCCWPFNYWAAVLHACINCEWVSLRWQTAELTSLDRLRLKYCLVSEELEVMWCYLSAFFVLNTVVQRVWSSTAQVCREDMDV